LNRQGVGFGTAFDVSSIGLVSAVLVLGTLTGVRVHNASVDDAALIIGMNRIRAAYVAIDPGLAPYFVASCHDDRAGLMQTYTMGAALHMFSHVVGSTSMFMTVVNAIVAGVLDALIANAANATPTFIAIIGLSALAYFFVMLAIGRRTSPKRQLMPASRRHLPDSRAAARRMRDRPATPRTPFLADRVPARRSDWAPNSPGRRKPGCGRPVGGRTVKAYGQLGRARDRLYDRAPMEEGAAGLAPDCSGHSAGRSSRVPEPVWTRSGGSDQSRQTTPVPGGRRGWRRRSSSRSRGTPLVRASVEELILAAGLPPD
jgi:hypothetical protein